MMAQQGTPDDGDMGDQARSTSPTAAGVEIHRLIDDHHQVLFRYAYRLTGAVGDAEDLTQQTFLVAQQKLHQVRDPARVNRWLLAVLRSCYLKSCRKKFPIAVTNLEMSVETIADRTPELDRLDRQELQAAVHELPEDFKVVLLMFYFEDYSYKDIAAELGIPIGTVMSRLARAKGHLRARLTGQSSGKPTAGRGTAAAPAVAANNHLPPKTTRPAR